MSVSTWGIVGFGVNVNDFSIEPDFGKISRLGSDHNVKADDGTGRDLLSADYLEDMEGSTEFWNLTLQCTGHANLLSVCSDGGDKVYIYFPASQPWDDHYNTLVRDAGIRSNEDAIQYLMSFFSTISKTPLDLQFLQAIQDDIDYISDGGMG